MREKIEGIVFLSVFQHLFCLINHIHLAFAHAAGVPRQSKHTIFKTTRFSPLCTYDVHYFYCECGTCAENSPTLVTSNIKQNQTHYESSFTNHLAAIGPAYAWATCDGSNADCD